MPDPYRVYVGAASNNPGRCGVAVVVTRGDQRAVRTTTLAHGTYADALYTAFIAACALIMDKTSAPVVIVVSSIMLRSLALPEGAHPNTGSSAAREAFRLLVSSRTPDAPVSIEFQGHNRDDAAKDADAIAFGLLSTTAKAQP